MISDGRKQHVDKEGDGVGNVLQATHEAIMLMMFLAAAAAAATDVMAPINRYLAVSHVRYSLCHTVNSNNYRCFKRIRYDTIRKCRPTNLSYHNRKMAKRTRI